MQIDDAVRERLLDLEARIGLDALEVLDRNVLDEIDVAREQRRHPRARAGDGPEDDARPRGLGAPVALVALQDDAVALGVAHEAVRTGADRGLAGIELLGARIGADALARLPVERDRAAAVRLGRKDADAR